jgi:hypothetical protein
MIRTEPAPDSEPSATARALVSGIVRDRVLAGLVVTMTLAHVAYYFPRVVDDLFISLRYAENLAHGRGAVYNVGERVEGYSSPLWMLLESVGYVLHFEGVTWTKCLALASLFGLEYGLFRLARSVFGVGGWLAFLPALFCAANSYVVNWAMLGLETPAHLALLVLTPVALDGALRNPSRSARNWAILAVVGLGLTRPESLVYVGAYAVAPLLAVRSRSELAQRMRRSFQYFLPAFAVLALLLLTRYAYYGYFVPNTYFVKGRGEPFELQKLAPLWEQGAGVAESAVYLGGSALLVYYGVRRGALSAALAVLACLYFTASVRLDWMPSLRHLLPVTVLSPLGWTCFADDFARRSHLAVRLLQFAGVLVLGIAGVGIVQLDNRNSPEENRGRGWIRPKSKKKWDDTVLAYRRIEPPHVKRMGPYEMGQITQAWHVLEASREPVEDSWYVGRDIGAVGYYTGVRVFDTAGLFTAAVSHSPAWTNRRQVEDALIRKAMALRPLAGELYEGWELALGRDQELLGGYRVRRGSRQAPWSFIAEDRVPPSPSEVRRRYRALLEKFPALYHLHTLYGESMGAVVEKRARVVDAELPK